MPVEQSSPWNPVQRRAARRQPLVRRLSRHQQNNLGNGRPILRFTPYAWAKLEYLRDFGPTEIGAFGVSAPDDLLLVEDLHLVEQTCDVVSVAFDDAAVADYFDRQVDQGMPPERFARIWIHTHPGYSAAPSALDETTFARVFGRSNWAVMFILARGGSCQGRLRFSVGPMASQRVSIAVDYSRPFAGSDHAAWQNEYQQMVQTSFDHRFEPTNAIASNKEDDPWQ
jgi:hypothetical protein